MGLGKRDYKWNVDTLKYPGSYQTNMQSIWASSAQDVYVVGHNDQNRGQMYHFDGVNWKPVRLAISEGGTIAGAFDLWAVHGLSKNEIWAVGEKIHYNPSPPPTLIDSSLIIRFNGSSWQEEVVHGGRALISVWASSSTDIWAAGSHGTMYHFNGTQWSQYAVANAFFYGSITALSGGQFYTVAYREDWSPPNDSAASFLFGYDGTTWSTLDTAWGYSGAPEPPFGGTVWSDRQRLYSVGPNVYGYNAGAWNKIFTGRVGHICKSAENNLFATGQSVYHFNGADWFEFSQFRTPWGFFWEGSFTNGQETFVLGVDYRQDPQFSVILHGK